jgi:hypothetical protein
VFHCHILEHEDAGMMLNYKVVDPQGWSGKRQKSPTRALTIAEHAG